MRKAVIKAESRSESIAESRAVRKAESRSESKAESRGEDDDRQQAGRAGLT